MVGFDGLGCGVVSLWFRALLVASFYCRLLVCFRGRVCAGYGLV